MSKENYLKLSLTIVFLGLIYVMSYAISNAKVVENEKSDAGKSIIDVKLINVDSMNMTFEGNNLESEFLKPVKVITNIVNLKPAEDLKKNAKKQKQPVKKPTKQKSKIHL